LRELEQKKPQLDDLIGTSENIKDGAAPVSSNQLPAQGKRMHQLFIHFCIILKESAIQLYLKMMTASMFFYCYYLFHYFI